MSLRGSLVSGLLFPLQEKLKGHTTIADFAELEASQWLSPAAIRALQLERLRAFLIDIGTNVPYYRDMFRQLAFAPDKVQQLSDLSALPFLGKPEIRANMEGLKSLTAQGLQRFNTGGSSGEPLIFYLGGRRVSRDVAAKRRATRWWGVDIGDPEIVVWGSPIELGSQDRVRVIRDRLFRTRLLSAFEMTSANLQRFVEVIRDSRPAMLFGYPSSLAHIAEYADMSGINLRELGIKVAFVTSERLYPHQRDTIERIFGCPVANGYGGRDAGFIAHECPSGSLHITAEDLIVETVRPDGSATGPGESGEIVVTHLATGEFPFVRYRTGDVGKLSDQPCSCGRGLPVLAEIEGRSTDFVIAADGTVMHGLALIYVLRDLEGVGEFKIVQESLDHIRIQVVPDGAWNESVGEKIGSGIRQRLGEQVAVELELMQSIPAEASGKRRYVISKVDPVSAQPPSPQKGASVR